MKRGGTRPGAGRPLRRIQKALPVWVGQITPEERALIQMLTTEERFSSLWDAALNKRLDVGFLDAFDACQLECDGLTRVLHTCLTHRDIPHWVYAGSVTHLPTRQEMSPHYWITLPDGRFVDYRARMWLRCLPGVPHGTFVPANYPDIKYTGTVTPLETLTPGLLVALAGEAAQYFLGENT